MNTVYRVLLVAFILLSTVLVFIVVRTNRARVEPLDFEVSEDSITAYEQRADSLGRVAEVLEADLNALGVLDQLPVRARLDGLKREISALRVAVDKWKSGREKYDSGTSYRQCILLYGRATGICDALSEDLPAQPGNE